MTFTRVDSAVDFFVCFMYHLTASCKTIDCFSKKPDRISLYCDMDFECRITTRTSEVGVAGSVAGSWRTALIMPDLGGSGYFQGLPGAHLSHTTIAIILSICHSLDPSHHQNRRQDGAVY